MGRAERANRRISLALRRRKNKGAQAAVVAVYARLMLDVNQLKTKDGPHFRLINAQDVRLSTEQVGEYADCGSKAIMTFAANIPQGGYWRTGRTG